MNGSGVTIIQGASDPDAPDGFGDAAIRCVWMTNDAALVGFTLQGGFTRAYLAGSNYDDPDFSGGGLYAVSDLAVVSNCVLSANSAFYSAGGAFRGTLLGCTLVSNITSQGSGGAAHESTLHDCEILDNEAAIGGGVSSCTVSGSVLAGNFASGQHGGGALSSHLVGCLMIGNRTRGGIGGGAYGGSLKNCTVVGNRIVGVANASVTNCIIYFNTGREPGVDDNYYHSFGPDIHFSCTFPMPTNGVGNITNNPGFVDLAASNLQLSASSPCRDAGLLMGTASATDLAGNPRLVHGFIDMGAYEFQGGAGPADYDGDGYGNGEEQIAGTDLADPESFFRVDLLVSTNGLALVFDSVTN
ncbi:MAG: choice-of-anchor Q domain-containing protein, partial [Luteolibacter sp.]